MKRLSAIDRALVQRTLWAVRLAMSCVFVVSQSALAGTTGLKTVEWREEVKLSNSQVIVVERGTDYRRVSEPGRGSGWLADNERVRARFDAPTKIDVSWKGSLQPIALDATDQGDVYLVAVVTTADGQREFGLPQGSYHVALKSSAARRWERVPLSAMPKQFRPNLLVATYSLFITRNYPTDRVLDTSFKSSVDADPRIVPQFRDWARE